MYRVKRKAPSALICIALLCVLVGCGYKTNPRPSAATIPGEIGLPDAHAFPDRVELKWEVPLSNTDGSALKDISGFKVYRVSRKVGEECENCQDNKSLHANVDFQNPVNATITGREVSYTDRDVSPGNVYIYSVPAYNFRGREGASSPDVTVSLDDFPPPPEGLKAESDGVQVTLEWAQPPRPAGIRNYRVYRGETEKPEDMRALGGTKWAETQFTDKDVQPNKTYFYAVRSLKMNQGVPHESTPSPAANVMVPSPKRQPPENVNTALGRDSIGVGWDPVKLPDGPTQYNVYRSESGKTFLKVNPEALTTTRYTDKNVTAGTTYRYAVTAFPQGKPDEESTRSASEAVQFKP